MAVKTKKLLIAAVFAVLCGATPCYAATHQAASCSQADVQAAVTASSSGDTVTVPAGTCVATWTGVLSITVPITLQGNDTHAGATWTDNTQITLSNPSAVDITVTLGSSATFTRITGFTFSYTGAGVNAGLLTITGPLSWPPANFNFRFDNNHVTSSICKRLQMKKVQ